MRSTHGGTSVRNEGASEGVSEKMGGREPTGWLTCWELIVGDHSVSLGGNWVRGQLEFKGGRGRGSACPHGELTCLFIRDYFTYF